MSSTISSHQILELLSDKHHEDIFIPECKDGSTWFSTHLRLDAWVMTRSWKKMAWIGYEIKVSRSDFLKDQKMHLYLDLCNQLYVVAPKEILSADELHPEIGLMSPSKTGNKLFIIKKAAHRDIKPPVDLLLYILMCRAKFTKEYHLDKRDYWKQWLEDKKIDYTLGHSVSQALQKTIKERIDQVDDENRRLKDQIKILEEIKEILVTLGINDNPHAWSVRSQLDQIKKNLADSIDPDFKNNILGARRALDDLITKIDINQSGVV
jgi:hypothetical protein